ncbi:hypothetical protein SNOG_00768 [Parastagonospora nodorum SN15]|uniref:Uncharacterized protein n=1 Tax=Phaeosphaeria nodorum (strain SN15 / ATCC MYA-4574 / FGSC 10173) TaxID=321614 RepID=Q0V5E6_PHANO|nr:hypothetical protein SNOG_00768 [Parastagonospora nodorum SN15]EAT92263.1 hypothetical protein SNOG_00768 [Parastagonospora nodorum SN15]
MSQKPQGVGASNLALRRRPKAVSAVPRVFELLWAGFDSTARLHSPQSLSQRIDIILEISARLLHCTDAPKRGAINDQRSFTST